jgi:hypothetical protein
MESMHVKDMSVGTWDLSFHGYYGLLCTWDLPNAVPRIAIVPNKHRHGWITQLLVLLFCKRLLSAPVTFSKHLVKNALLQFSMMLFYFFWKFSSNKMYIWFDLLVLCMLLNCFFFRFILLVFYFVFLSIIVIRALFAFLLLWGTYLPWRSMLMALIHLVLRWYLC